MDGLNFDLLNRVKTVENFCEIHQLNMVQFSEELEPFCMACAKEKLEQRNNQLTQRKTDNYHKRSTYGWLNGLSLLADETLKEATFDTYEVDEEETVMNKRRARYIAKDYLDGKVFNTIMSGTPGTGKSHLSMSILQAVNENSTPYRRCLFVSVDELMRRIKDSFSNKQADYTEQDLIERLGKTDLLVLDDLGAETGAIPNADGKIKPATDFTIRTLYAVVNARMDKPTIITTNLSSEVLKVMYDRKLLSRMYQGAKAANSILTFKNTKDKRSEIVF